MFPSSVILAKAEPSVGRRQLILLLIDGARDVRAQQARARARRCLEELAHLACAAQPKHGRPSEPHRARWGQCASRDGAALSARDRDRESDGLSDAMPHEEEDGHGGVL